MSFDNAHNKKGYDLKNKGFTMVELLVALGISSIVIGLIFSFFISNYKGYESVKNDLELQFQAQYILNFMVDKIVNSNSLSLVKQDNVKDYSMTLVRSKETEYPLKKISFKYGNEEENYVFHIVLDSIRYGKGAKDMAPTVELGKFVDNMYVSLFEDSSFQNAKAVIIKIVMKKDGQTYNASQAVKMRN